MPDSKPTADPQPAPQPEPEKPKVIRGVINQKLIDALDKAALVVAAARKPEYAPALAARDVSADTVSQLDSQIAACQARFGKTYELRNVVRAATEAESQAQDVLLPPLKEIQTAAKQKYGRTAPQQTKDYYVGQKLDAKRATFVQMTDSILEKLKTDVLPGITPAKVAALKTLRDAYVAANLAQADAQSKATAEREAIEAAVEAITAPRVQVQLAADAEWPAGNKANAPIRREFQLPPDRPFSG